MADKERQPPSSKPNSSDDARLSTEAIRVIAQSVPNMMPLADAAAGALAPDAEYRLREIIQDSVKFMKHSKRSRLMPSDINAALRLRNVEPIYGFGSNKRRKLNSASVVQDPNSRGLVASPDSGAEPPLVDDDQRSTFTQVAGVPDLFFLEDAEVSVKSLVQLPMPELPLEVTVSAHWLAIDGNQPAIAQNPTRQTAKSLQREDDDSGADVHRPANGKVETEVKPVLKHDLSRELQLYLDQITDAVLGTNIPRLHAVLDSVAQEPGVVQLLPYFTLFVTNGVSRYLRNLPILFALMRLVNAILDNEAFLVENYLHQLLPAVMSCIVGKRLSANPRENHWALRDYSARIVERICSKYARGYAQLQPKITKTLIDAIANVQRPLTTHYGAIIGIAVLGKQVVDSLLIPRLGGYARKVKKVLQDKNQKPIRRFEASKVFGAIAWAVSLPNEQPNGLQNVDAENSSVSQKATKLAVEISMQRFAEVLPNCEGLFDILKREMGEQLYPYGSMQSEDEMIDAMLKFQTVAK